MPQGCPFELRCARLQLRTKHSRLDSHECLRLSRRPRRSEEHTSELQSLMRNLYAVICLKNQNTIDENPLAHILKPSQQPIDRTDTSDTPTTTPYKRKMSIMSYHSTSMSQTNTVF